MKLIVRADDMGYSEAFNYGYYKAIKEGIVTSAEIMVDMPGAEQAAEMLREFPWLPVGIHLHLCGRPCSSPEMIPHLIGEDGLLNVKYTRNMDGPDIFPYDELRHEFKAQFERYKKLLGRYPDVSGVPVKDENSNYARALMDTIKEYHTPYLLNNVYYKWVCTDGVWSTVSYPVKPMLSGREGGRNNGWGPIEQQAADYCPEDTFLKMNREAYKDDAVYYAVFHPGYLDSFIMKNSRLTVGRCKDVAACTSKEVMAKLRENNVELITCYDLMYETNNYQIFLKNRQERQIG